jgi:hypothetical protein
MEAERREKGLPSTSKRASMGIVSKNLRTPNFRIFFLVPGDDAEPALVLGSRV